MKTFFYTVLAGCCTFSFLNGDPLDWATDALPPAPSTGVNVDIMVGAGPNSNQTTAVWADSTTYAPYYSIYSNGTWLTGPIPLTVTGGTDSVGVYDDVYIAPGPNSGELVATWNDYGSEFPYYSIYNGSSWTTGQISLGTANGAYDDVTVAQGPSSGQAMATWANVGGGNGPYYSIYDGSTWTTGTIDLGSSTAVKFNVFITQGPSTGTMLAAWGDRFTAVPYYSIYSGGLWTTGSIPLGGSAGTSNEVIVAQGPTSGEIVAVWTDNSTRVPYYSIYSGGSWNTGTIPLGTSTAVNHNIYITPGVTPGSLVAAWVDLSTKVPYYAVYSNGAWAAAELFPLSTSTGSQLDVTIAQLLGGSGLIAAWSDNSGYPYPPYFSYLSSPAPLPPTDGVGIKIKNRFPLLIQWYNELKWTASASSEVAGYNIRRNGILIAQGVVKTSYVDYNRPKKGVDVYTITSVDNQGAESLTSLEITIR